MSEQQRRREVLAAQIAATPVSEAAVSTAAAVLLALRAAQGRS